MSLWLKGVFARQLLNKSSVKLHAAQLDTSFTRTWPENENGKCFKKKTRCIADLHKMNIINPSM